MALSLYFIMRITSDEILFLFIHTLYGNLAHFDLNNSPTFSFADPNQLREVLYEGEASASSFYDNQYDSVGLHSD